MTPPVDLESGSSKPHAILSLARDLLSRIDAPKDHWEVAAHLEVSGIRDADVRDEYGCADVFALAQEIMALATEVTPRRPPPAKRPAPLLWRFLKGYVTGLLFAMPMAAQTFFMILFGYSLWAWIEFSTHEATAIALGTVASFIVTGGFTQAISRRGMFYIHQHEDILTRAVSYRMTALAVVTVVVVGVFFFVANLLFEILPLQMVVQAELYFFMLSLLWLSSSILYMLRKQLLCAAIICLALLVVHVPILLFNVPIVLAHTLGLVTAIALSFVSGWLILTRRAKRAHRDYAGAALPRPSILVYATAAYFWYGLLYFSFLFADRVIAWSTEAGRGLLPYFIWFDSRYELGMDWALLCFVLTVGILEFTIQEFSDRIIPGAQAVRADDAAAFNRTFTRFYYWHLALFALAAFGSIVVSFWGLTMLRNAGVFPFIEVFFNPVTKSVFWWAALGYVFLVLGLFNSVFLFALSRPFFVLRALGAGFVLNVIVGFVLSRVVSSELAVVGLTVGAFVFMLLSSLYARRAFNRLDYYYYSAY